MQIWCGRTRTGTARSMTDIASITGGSLSVLSILVFLSFQPTPTPAVSTTESATAGVHPWEPLLHQSVSTLYES